MLRHTSAKILSAIRAQCMNVANLAGMPVRLGRPFDLSGFEHGEAGPGYAVAAGSLRWRFDHPLPEDAAAHFAPSLAGAAQAMRSAAGRAVDWLRENF